MTSLSGSRRGGRFSRTALLLISLFVCAALFVGSVVGLLAPVESLAASPLNALSGLLDRAALAITNGVSDFAALNQLRERNAALEESLARLQPQYVEALEIVSDYERLAALFNYASRRADQQFLAADVIGGDANNLLRSSTIIVNRGARDGIAAGMPVVAGEGTLIGRVIGVSVDAAQVLLITSSSSAVSARIQETRVSGSVIGDVNAALEMELIPLGAAVSEGDIIITSGLGGIFPPDILIGQVSSVRQQELFQVAQIRSLVDFDTLELVLIITNFQPVDLSVFDEGGATAPGP
jgi:rod shape-determining protein MreC